MNFYLTGNFQSNIRLPQANLKLHVAESFLRSEEVSQLVKKVPECYGT